MSLEAWISVCVYFVFALSCVDSGLEEDDGEGGGRGGGKEEKKRGVPLKSLII
jgi:hypothetical protein